MLESLALHGFRNLKPLQWSIDEGSHLLLGGNGAGKTSLLEAVYVVATTRSFRTSQLRDCLQKTALPDATPAFSISASVRGSKRARLDLSLAADGKLRRELDGSSVALPEYLQPLPVVVWSAEEAKILTGSPDQRRRMLDRGLVASDLARLRIVSTYRRCLQQKRELLKRGQSGLREWNHLLAAAAWELALARSEYASLLEEALTESIAQAGLLFPPISLRYRPSPKEALEGAERIEERLSEATEEERRRRRPVLGPHRDQLDLLWDGTDISEIGSAGEKKALGLLLLSAQAAVLERAQRPPIVLADDLDAELDLERLARVWRPLSRFGQVLASTNRTEVSEALEVTRTWAVAAGEARPSEGS